MANTQVVPIKKERIFNRSFWTYNSIEMFERLAYFALRAVVPLYIMQADEPGGLHFTAEMKGTIYGWWFIFQCVLPTFTGGYADRYGYKKTLFVSYTINILGYVLMAYMRSYAGFFFAVMMLATGTAIFKPALQGSLAQNLSKKNSSMGWGIFYWVVNIGGMFAPYWATFILGAPHTVASWNLLFLTCAGITSINYLLLFTVKDVPSGANKTDNAWVVLKKTIKNFMEIRLVVWLFIMACFWLMMYQLWDLHPNFVTDWIDSSPLAKFIPFDSWLTQTDRGPQVQQQILIGLNAMLIVALVVPISWMVRKMRVLSCMVIGMIMGTTALLASGLSMCIWVFVLGVLFFSIGEMMTGPKKTEYLGLIAPPGKKALYLGYVNISVGIGGYVGSKMAGFLYGNYGEKATLALKYIAEHTPFGLAKNWDGNIQTLETVLGITRTDAVTRLQEIVGMNLNQVTELLWKTYNPQYHVWLPFAAIGLFATVALVVFAQMAKRWKDMDA